MYIILSLNILKIDYTWQTNQDIKTILFLLIVFDKNKIWYYWGLILDKY